MKRDTQPPRWKTVAGASFLVAVIFVMLRVSASQGAKSPTGHSSDMQQRGFLINFNSETTGLTTIFDEFSIMLGGENGLGGIMRYENPNSILLSYMSGTDINAPPNGTGPEYDRLETIAAEMGIDIEQCFLHFWDSTEVTLNGVTTIIPGWKYLPANQKYKSRINAYAQSYDYRYVTNLSTPSAMQAYKLLAINTIGDAKIANANGDSVWVNGIMLDNCYLQAPVHPGIVTVGAFNAAHAYAGAVMETGIDPSGPDTVAANMMVYPTDHTEISKWYTLHRDSQNTAVGLAPFFKILRDTLSTAASWHPSGEYLWSAANVSSSYPYLESSIRWPEFGDSIITTYFTDLMVGEFLYNPNATGFGVGTMWAAESRYAASDWYGILSPPSKTRGAVPFGGEEITYAEDRRNSFALVMVLMTGSTYIPAQQVSNSPYTWRTGTDYEVKAQAWEDSVGWGLVTDTTLAYIGDPIGEPYVLVADDSSECWGRDFTNGLALVRTHTGQLYNGASSASRVPLPRTLHVIEADGSFGAPADSYDVRIGMGFTFLETLPSHWLTTPVALSSFTASPQLEGILLEWATSSEINFSGFHIHRSSSPMGDYDRLTDELVRPTAAYRFFDTDVNPGITYSYRLEALDRTGDREFFGPVSARMEPHVEVSRGPALGQASPNPVHGGASVIPFALAEPGSAKIRILDVTGRLVRVLLDEVVNPGERSVTWDGRNDRGEIVPAGIYFYQLQANGFEATRKLVRLQ